MSRKRRKQHDGRPSARRPEKHSAHSQADENPPASAAHHAPATAPAKRNAGDHHTGPLLSFDKRHKTLLAVILALWCLLSLCQFHGYSIAAWNKLLGDPQPTSVLWGEAQNIRLDDWIVSIPFILSQRLHQPRFPVFNTLISEQGVNMLICGPSRHPTTLLRPTDWGYFVSDGFGLAWKWWLGVFGLFYSCFLVFMIVSRNRFGLSVTAALALLFSPFVQFWAMNCAVFILFAAFGFVAAVHVLFARTTRNIVINSALFGYCGAVFTTTLYPPYQVTLGYLFLILLIAVTIQEVSRGRCVDRIAMRTLGLSAALLFIAAATAYFLIEARDALELMAHTVYPGNRVTVGGSLRDVELFNANFFAAKFVTDWGDLRSICRAASYVLIFPVVLLKIAWDWLADHRRPTWPILSMCAFLGVLLVWGFIGVPPVVAKITLLSRVPEIRSILGYGIAEMILLVAYVSWRQPSKSPARDRAVCGTLAALWCAAMIFEGLRVQAVIPDLSTTRVCVFGAASCAIAFLVLSGRPIAIACLAALGIYGTIWFNPLAKGGVDSIRNQPLSRTIVDLDRTVGQSRWAVFSGIRLPNLFRVIGVHAVNGVHPYPQFDFWKKLDPDGQFVDAYNRYAHVIFKTDKRPRALTIFSNATDSVTVRVNPDNPEFLALDLDFILCLGRQKNHFDRSTSYRHITSFGQAHIYQVVRQDNTR